jgi:hypothetical protein
VQFPGVWLHNAAFFNVQPTRFHLCSSHWCGSVQQPRVSWWLHLHSMWPNLLQCTQRLSGPAFVCSSTLYRTPVASTLLLTRLSATNLPFAMMTTNDGLISPLWTLSWMVQVFGSHLNGPGLVNLSFFSWIASLTFCSPSVTLPINLTSGMVWFFSLAQLLLIHTNDSFVDQSSCLDNDVSAQAGHICSCILVCDCAYFTLGSHSGIHNLNMCRNLLQGQCNTECQRNVLVDHTGLGEAFIASPDQQSIRQIRAGCRGQPWGQILLSAQDGVGPYGRCRC